MKKWQYTVSKNGRHQISEVGGGNVCMVWNCKDKERNAHLIKTAPKLYKFLESLQLDVANDYIRDELLAEARGEQ